MKKQHGKVIPYFSYAVTNCVTAAAILPSPV